MGYEEVRKAATTIVALGLLVFWGLTKFDPGMVWFAVVMAMLGITTVWPKRGDSGTNTSSLS